MHMIQGELSMLDVSNTTTRDTIAEVNPRIKAKFYRNGQGGQKRVCEEIQFQKLAQSRKYICVHVQ